MATIKYFATRDLARVVAREEGEIFRDMGKDAPKGKRWAVEFKELSDVIAAVQAVEMNVPTAEDKALNDALRIALNGLDVQPVKELPKPDSIVRTDLAVLTNRKGRQVQVFTKRRVSV